MEESIKAGVVDVCVDMQQRARDMAERYRREMGRFYYVTPTSYLELINTFKVKYRKLPAVNHSCPRNFCLAQEMALHRFDLTYSRLIVGIFRIDPPCCVKARCIPGISRAVSAIF